MLRGLLLDIGGVVIRTPFELLDAAEDRLGLRRGALGARGPLDLDGDPEFGQVLDGRLTERAYWARRAARAAAVVGTAPEPRAFMGVLFDRPEADVVRPAAVRLLADATSAGLRVGMLTNDLVDFHGQDWVDRIGVFAAVDALVDGSVTGHLKPAPKAFLLGADALGLRPDEVLLLDDQPVNVAGARQVRMEAVHVDATRPAAAFGQARERLGMR